MRLIVVPFCIGDMQMMSGGINFSGVLGNVERGYSKSSCTWHFSDDDCSTSDPIT
jgi:hypothetical protein